MSYYELLRKNHTPGSKEKELNAGNFYSEEGAHAHAKEHHIPAHEYRVNKKSRDPIYPDQHKNKGGAK